MIKFLMQKDSHCVFSSNLEEFCEAACSEGGRKEDRNG